MKKRIYKGRRIFTAFLIAVILICLAATMVAALYGDTDLFSFGVADAPMGSATAEAFASGDGTAENPYMIADAGHLRLLAGIVNGTITQIGGEAIQKSAYNYPSVHYSLSNDIVINDTYNYGAWNELYAPKNVFTPIGTAASPFMARFDGAGHTISGLYVNEDNHAGLFGVISLDRYEPGAIIQNINITKSTVISRNESVGSLAGLIEGNVELRNCTSDAKIVSMVLTKNTDLQGGGGIVGKMQGTEMYSPTVADCVFSGCVEGKLPAVPDAGMNNKNIGGIAGSMRAKSYGTYEHGPRIENCVNKGEVEVSLHSGQYYLYVGGLVGHFQDGGFITNSGNEGIVRVSSNHGQVIGGVVGYLNQWNGGTLSGLWNTGDIYSEVLEAVNPSAIKAAIGGVIGHIWNQSDRSSDIKDLYNSGTVHAAVDVINTYIGGIVGESDTNTGMNLKIGNAVNEGDLSATGSGKAAVGAAIGNSKIPLILNNFINYNINIAHPNDDGLRVAGQYPDVNATLSGNNIILPYESIILMDNVYKERNAEIFFLQRTGVTHKNIAALSLLNTTSQSENLSAWVNVGKRKTTGGGDSTYFAPQIFADRFGTGGEAFDSSLPVYEAFAGKGTQAEPYLIENAQQLFSLQRIFNEKIYMGTTLSDAQMTAYKGPNVYYKLAADIYFNDVADHGIATPKNVWKSINAFEGVFDGAGYTIYGLYMTSSGFFDNAQHTTIKNLNLEKAFVKGSAILVRDISNSIIENVRVSGRCEYQASYVGAIASTAQSVSVRNCVADVKMINIAPENYYLTQNVGGIVGQLTGDQVADPAASEVVDCAFYGSIESHVTVSHMGGIVGLASNGVLIQNCVLYGKVQGTYYVGGILGFGVHVRIIGCSTSAQAAVNCYGNIYSMATVGGLAGTLNVTAGSYGYNVVAGCVSAAPIRFEFVSTSSTSNIYAAGIVGNVSKDAKIMNNRVLPTASIECYVPDGASGKYFYGGGVVAIINEEKSAEGAKIVIAGNVVEATIRADEKITNSTKIFAGICSVVKNSNTIVINNVVESFNYDIGTDRSSSVVASTLCGVNIAADMTDPLTVETNFVGTAPGDAAFVNGNENRNDVVINNYHYDRATGNLKDGEKDVTYRLEESKVLVATIEEARNARAAEYNFPAAGALPLFHRIAYIRYDNAEQTPKLNDEPIYYTRFIANRPDNTALEGGFLVSDGTMIAPRSTLNDQPVAYAGFTILGWTYGSGENVYFDFSMPVDRNYTFQAVYEMDDIAVAPSADIDIVYDGKSHTIALNADVKHSLGTRTYHYSETWIDGPASVEQIEGDGVTFEKVIPSNRVHDIRLIVSHTDVWGKTYSKSVTHRFGVEIRPATLTVTGLIAESRKYDTTLDVTLRGGEIYGVKESDAGTRDDVSVVSIPTKGTLADKHVGKNKIVSFSDIRIQGADASNYVFEQPVVKTDITPAQISLNGVAAVNKVYDGQTRVGISATYLNNVLGSDSVSFDPTDTVATVADKNVGTARPVTVESVALAGADKNNYVCVIPTGLKVDITPKQLNIVNLAVAKASRPYDRTTDVALVGGELSGVIAGDAVFCDMPAFGSVASKNIDQGKKVSVTAPALTGGDADNYTVAIAGELYIDIVQKDVIIKNLKAVDRIYNRTNSVELTEAVLDGFIPGDDVTFSVPTKGEVAEVYAGQNKPVSISWGKAQGLDANNYNIILPELVTVNILPKPLSVEGITAMTRQYDGTLRVEISGAGATLRNVEQGDDVGFKLPQYGTLESADAGQNKTVSVTGITLTSPTAPNVLKNYTITTQYAAVDIAPREIAARWGEATSFIYNGSEQAPSAVASTGVNGEFAVLTVTGGQTNAGGPYTAAAALSAVTNGQVSNYLLTETTCAFAIAQRSLKVTINEQVMYVADTPWSHSLWDGNVSGLVSGHAFFGTVSTKAADIEKYTSQSDGFVYEGIVIRDAQSAEVTANYSIEYDLTVVILEAGIEYDAKGYIGVYDAQAHTVILNVKTPNITVKYGVDPQQLGSDILTFTDAGEYVVYFELSGTNYKTVPGSATVRITPAPITVALTAPGGVYNGSPVEATYTVAGNLGNVDVTLTYTGTTNGGKEYDDTAAPAFAGSYSVTATVDDTNYALGFTRESFVIGRAVSTIDVAGVTREYVYNGEEQAVDSGALPNHSEAAAVYENNTFTHVGTGTYTIRIYTVQTDNYLAAETTVEIVVKKADLVDASVGYTDVYDGKFHGISVQATNFKGTDDMRLATIEYSLDGQAWSSEAITGRNVADSVSVHYNMSFADYNDLSGTQTIAVSPKNLTIEGVTARDQAYDGLKTVKLIRGGSLIGTVADDQVYPVVPTGGTMSDKHVGENKPVILDPITLAGDAAGNYTLTQPQVFVNVTPISVSVQGLHAIDKVYDGSVSIEIGTADAGVYTVISGDDINVVEAVGAAEDAAAGENKNLTITSITLGGKDKGNYVVTLPTGLRCTIRPKALAFTLKADGGTYSGAPIAATVTVADALEGDSVTVWLRYTGTTNGGTVYDSDAAPAPAGVYTVAAAIDNANYVLDGATSKEFTIDRAEAVIDVSAVKDEYVYIGYKQIVDSGARLNHDEAEVGYYDNIFTDVGTGSYLVRFRAEQSDNYRSAYAEKTVTIAKRAITVTLETSAVVNGTAWTNSDWEGCVDNLIPGHVFTGKATTVSADAGIYDSAANGFVFADIAITDESGADVMTNYEIDYALNVVVRAASIAGTGGVEISSEHGFDPGVNLQTEALDPDAYVDLKLDDQPVAVLAAKDISLTDNGLPVAIEGTVTVKMLIDEALRGRNDLMVVFIDDDGSLTNMNARREGDYMVFETDHNSVYAIVAFETAEVGSKPLSDGAIAGIAIGVAVLIIIAIAVILSIRRKKNHSDGFDGESPDGGYPDGGTPDGENESHTTDLAGGALAESADAYSEEAAEQTCEADPPSEASETEASADIFAADEQTEIPATAEETPTANAEPALDEDATAEAAVAEHVLADVADANAAADHQSASEDPTAAAGSDDAAYAQTAVTQTKIAFEDANEERPSDEDFATGDAVAADPGTGVPLQENAVVFVPTEQSLDEAFAALSEKQKDFYRRLRAHALEKEGAVANKTQSYEAIKSGRRNIVKFSVKRATVVASFSLEHPLLKQYKKQSGEGDAIKSKPTDVIVSSSAAFKAAKDMIDIIAAQLALEKSASRKKGRSAKAKASDIEATSDPEKN